mgnify:CR=1 FL=1
MENLAAAQGAVVNLVGVNSVSKLTATTHISLALLTSSSWVATTITGAIGWVQISGLMGSNPRVAFATSVKSFDVVISAFPADRYQLLVHAKGSGLVGHVAKERL